MGSGNIWLFNIKPHNWRSCVDGPPKEPVHAGHVDHPWHGLNKNTAWAADQMERGDTAIVRQSRHGVMGIWEVEDTAPVESQDVHNWSEDYEVFVYCRELHRELEPPLDDTEFLHHHDYVRFNAGANRLSDDDAEEFLTHILERDDLSREAQTRVVNELEQLGITVSDEVSEDTGDVGRETTAKPDPDESASDLKPPERTETTVSRIVRNTQLVKDLKQKYDHRCQVCGERRQRGEDEPYAEGHHLHPLGDSPPGVDHESNILVLCPNHHADFDYGVIEVDPETYELSHAYEDRLNGRQLMVKDDHEISTEYIEYHRDQISEV